MRIHKLALAIVLVLSCVPAVADGKPKMTLDEFFNSVRFNSVELSPDGSSVIIGTERADWDQQIFRNDLWVYHDDGKGGSPIQLTQSGHDTSPKWSPDGRWIAFLSDRKTTSEKNDNSDSENKDNDVNQIYLISPNGGEAFAITRGEEEVHAFSWSADSKIVYFATRYPWTKPQNDDYKKQWKDVLEYRTADAATRFLLLTWQPRLQITLPRRA